MYAGFEPDAPPSAVWMQAGLLFGETIPVWEPDTFRIELSRRSIEPTDSLMARLLGAQTILTSPTWLHDHVAFFAFACACDGIPASYDVQRQPTVEQLCWAILECERFHPGFIKGIEDVGFDPDEVDAAISVVLLDDGWAVLPEQLTFCEDVFKRLYRGDPDLPGRVSKAWDKIKHLDAAALAYEVRHLDETAVNVQLQRLADCRLAVDARIERRTALYGRCRG